MRSGNRAPVLCAFLTLLIISPGVRAQHAGPQRFAQPATQSVSELSTDAWIAAGFIVGTIAMSPLDRSLAHALQDSARQENVFLQKTAAALRFLGFPGPVIIGASIYAVGRFADDRDVAAIGLHGTEAMIIANAFVFAGKNVLGRARPYNDVNNPFNFKLGRGFTDGDRYRSFPSGHTAAAFAVAAAVTAESRKIWPDVEPYVGPVLYTGAALVGVSRMYHNRHWASDVVGGAAIGVLTGSALIRYLYSHNSTLDDWLLPDKEVPAPQGAARALESIPLVFVWSYPVRW